MPDIENGQHWLDRNRPPRVQITYDVEIGDAVEKKELPLVVGVLAHLDRKERALAEKKFESVDRDNFDAFLRDLAPKITVSGRDITFTSMQDFHPLGLLRHPDLPELRALFEERQKLRDMLAKLDGNAELDMLLSNAIVRQEGNAAGGKDALEQALQQSGESAKAVTGARAVLKARTAALQEAEGRVAAAEAAVTQAQAAVADAQKEVDAHKLRMEAIYSGGDPKAAKAEYRAGEKLFSVLADAQAALDRAKSSQADAAAAKEEAAKSVTAAEQDVAAAQSKLAEVSGELSEAAKQKS